MAHLEDPEFLLVALMQADLHLIEALFEDKVALTNTLECGRPILVGLALVDRDELLYGQHLTEHFEFALVVR